MLKKRIIPLICLLVFAGAVIAGIVYLQDKQDTTVQEPVVYQPYQLKNIASQINETIWAVQDGKTTEDEIFYEPKNKAVLMDVDLFLMAKKDCIWVYFHDLTDEKIEVFNRLFPYNCFRFSDVDSLMIAPT
ncbi:MAG: hypothetical protein IJE90_07690 [Clostridia bacterium]|nr:hypothetical protein [Clostridia bacterium]